MFREGTYRKVEPASAAIVMAIGIFLIGTIEAFPLLDKYLGTFFSFILLIIWLVIYSLLSIQFFHKDFIIPFLKHPVNSFAMGTWIAGVSVLCNVFLDYFPSMIKITQIIALFNSLLWILFFLTCVYNFKKLFLNKHNYEIHGMLLLSTVGTQSIIILLNNVFFQFPIVFSEIIILVGLAFYLIGVFLIAIDITHKENWTIRDNLSNTNCIIHGALSITGFAMITTDTFSALTINLLWMVTFLLLIAIEGVELLRAKQRIQIYGWNQGVLSYHVSQWSRNFTFGMFYTFTLMMQKNTDYFLSENLTFIQESVMSIWAWVVLIDLIIEINIILKHLMGTYIVLKKI